MPLNSMSFSEMARECSRAESDERGRTEGQILAVQRRALWAGKMECDGRPLTFVLEKPKGGEEFFEPPETAEEATEQLAPAVSVSLSTPMPDYGVRPCPTHPKPHLSTPTKRRPLKVPLNPSPILFPDFEKR